MRLVSLTINKFRRVKPCTLEFADDLSVLLGKNGAGKTTLLKLIVAVTRMNFADFEEELDVVAVFVTGLLTVKVETNQTKPANRPLDNQPPQFAQAKQLIARTKVIFSHANGEPFWIKTVSGESSNSEGIEIRSRDKPALQVIETLASLMNSGKRPEWSADLKHFAHASADYFALRRFDESLGFFDGITQSNDALAIGRIVFGERTLRYLVPIELFDAWKFPESKGKLAVVAMNDECELLQRWAKYLSWTELSALIGLSDESQGVTTYSSLGFVAKSGDHTFRDDKFSFGQQRFLSFLYYAACHEHLLIVDELANGLHHDWIEICFAEMKGKQTIMSSQNPLVFDHLEFADAAAVSKALILCSQNEQGDMIWENMHRDSADHFYTSYQAGIRLVSEILREQNLW